MHQLLLVYNARFQSLTESPSWAPIVLRLTCDGHTAITPSSAPDRAHKNVSPESFHNLDVCVAEKGSVLGLGNRSENFVTWRGSGPRFQ